jgi:hypothetical protein
MNHPFNWFSYLVSVTKTAVWDEPPFGFKDMPSTQTDRGWVGPSINGDSYWLSVYSPFKNFHPPLLFRRPEDFLLIGVMTTLPVD